MSAVDFNGLVNWVRRELGRDLDAAIAGEEPEAVERAWRGLVDALMADRILQQLARVQRNVIEIRTQPRGLLRIFRLENAPSVRGRSLAAYLLVGASGRELVETLERCSVPEPDEEAPAP